MRQFWVLIKNLLPGVKGLGTTAVLEKTLESPLDCKESKPVTPKGNQL